MSSTYDKNGTISPGIHRTRACTMAGPSRRRSSIIDPASVESILAAGGASQPAAAPPSPHVGTSPGTASFAMFPPPRPYIQHTRTMSSAPQTRSNRLSLTLPVAPINHSNDSSRPTPTSSNNTSFPPTPAETGPIPSPNDTSSFLVALASQERRVFELKEELQKAERELDRLKKKWALHEATKKRTEIRNGEQLQPLQTITTGSGDPNHEVSALRQSIEVDRRKALLENVSKSSRRKIITGGHTRALSLLSPDRTTYNGQPFPPPRPSGAEAKSNANGSSRSTTVPDPSQDIPKIAPNRANARHSYQGGTAIGVKQIAEDVKAGIWTFLEDLRQATVGDEAINGTLNRGNLNGAHGPNRRGSKGSLLIDERGRHGQSTIDKSPFRTWDTLIGTSPVPLDSAEAPSLMKKKATRPVSMVSSSITDDLDDAWSNWDSPTPKSPTTRWSGSTTVSDTATPSKIGNNDQVKKSDPSTEKYDTPNKRDDIPWPDLAQLTPSHLKRTVTTIMKEWEKSLTPPPEERPKSIVACSDRVNSVGKKD